jgi:glycosyltransferase involved in cell wall biosynthesis
MPVLEAMATGLSVVTTDCFGTRSFCKHGHNSLIAEPDDVTGKRSTQELGGTSVACQCRWL